ncbi:MAG: RsmE family RNA methyltransferase [Acidimicrobiia bacterium]
MDTDWNGESLPLTDDQRHHLTRVLRLTRGAAATYTDGRGRVGEGKLGEGVVLRGKERSVPRPSNLEVAVAPPSSRDRQRFLVEKLAELGVARLRWVKTLHGGGRIASATKLASWVKAAVEQSRGAWTMQVDSGLCDWDDLIPPVVVCAPDGADSPGEAATVVIGPEGGFAPDEVPDEMIPWGLGPTVLRVETAAIVAAARMLG